MIPLTPKTSPGQDHQHKWDNGRRVCEQWIEVAGWPNKIYILHIRCGRIWARETLLTPELPLVLAKYFLVMHHSTAELCRQWQRGLVILLFTVNPQFTARNLCKNNKTSKPQESGHLYPLQPTHNHQAAGLFFYYVVVAGSLKAHKFKAQGRRRASP